MSPAGALTAMIWHGHVRTCQRERVARSAMVAGMLLVGVRRTQVKTAPKFRQAPSRVASKEAECALQVCALERFP